jgi:hypothetical protein
MSYTFQTHTIHSKGHLHTCNKLHIVVTENKTQMQTMGVIKKTSREKVLAGDMFGPFVAPSLSAFFKYIS